MNSIRPFILVLISILALTACDGGEEDQSQIALPAIKGISQVQSDALFSKLKDYPDQTELSLAFIEDSAARYYGFIVRNDSLIATNLENRVFEVGSITKLFTATLLAEMACDSTLSLSDSVSTYLGFMLKDSVAITLLQLANHTSGLPRIPSGLVISSLLHMDNPYKDFNDAAMKEYLQNDVGYTSPPGEEFAYSNLGAGILGAALANNADTLYGVLLSELIFGRYRMSSSTVDRRAATDNLVTPRDKKGKRTSNWDMASLAGAGAVLSTAPDLANFALAQFDRGNRALSLTRKHTFSRDEKNGIGLGWMIKTENPADPIFWHNGATGGYSSCMAIDTLRRSGVIILSNVSASNEYGSNIDALCFELLRTLQ